MPSQLDIDAAALQKFTRRDILNALLEAKRESDRRNYVGKTAILQKLLNSANKGEFEIDSEKGGVVGLTHRPLNFKIHMLRKQIPNYHELKSLPAKDASDNYLKDYDKWKIAAELDALIDSHGDEIMTLKKDAAQLPLLNECSASIWYNLDKNFVSVNCEEINPTLLRAWGAGLDKKAVHCQTVKPETYFDECWVLVKESSRAPLVKGVTDVWGLTEGPSNKWYGGPRPLASMLVGGLAGAGLGYLGGAFGEATTGKFEKGRLRKVLAILGAMGGAAPGALWAANNVSNYGAKGLLSDTDGNVQFKFSSVKELMPDIAEKVEAIFSKEAFAGAGSLPFSNPLLNEPIKVDDFANVVWSTNDPYSPFQLRAAASGLVQGASAMRGNSSIVSPADVASMAVGMGSGYLAGTLVGRTLGALAGLKPESQQALQQAGTWAGMLKTVVPMAFGNSGNPF